MVNFYQCRDCLLIFLNPQPNLDTLRKYYARHALLESGPAGAWLKHNRYYLREIYKDRLRDIVRYRESGDLLDIGCGMGAFCDVARDYGFDVYGTEVSDVYAEQIQTNINISEVFIGRIQEINFRGKTFDVISLWHVLEHVPDPLDTLFCAKKLLKPGGIVGIEVPNVENARKRPIYQMDIEDYPMDEQQHLFYYSGRTLDNICTKAGFTVLKMKFMDAHQPSRNIVKHLLRKIKRPSKRIVYYGRENRGFSAMRIFLTV